MERGVESLVAEGVVMPNAVSRIFMEQWITFPRFVLSGGWLRALRQIEQRRCLSGGWPRAMLQIEPR